MAIAFKDMQLDDEDQENCAIAVPCTDGTTKVPKKLLPEYPWGLRVSLDDAGMKKLGIAIEDLPVGAMVHMHCLARVTSVSQDQRQDGSTPCRAELQIEQMALESEDEENEEAEAEAPKPRVRLRAAYGK